MRDERRRWSNSWRQPGTREARNEQRKLRGGVFNAVAIGAVVTGLIGPWINPALEALTPFQRAGLVLLGYLAHLVGCVLVREMEDKP